MDRSLTVAVPLEPSATASGTAPSPDRIDWAALAKIDTVVFYMAVGRLAEIAERLIGAGRGGDTPAAVVQDATLPTQRTIAGTLATLPRLASEAGVAPPAVVFVGDVVAMRRLGWFEDLPLAGATVLVTRARRQASSLAARLAEMGAAVIEAPTIDIQPVTDFAAMDAAICRLAEFDWIVFTSPNGVEALLDRMADLGRDARAMGRAGLAAIGPATAEALRARFLRADLTPAEFTGESLGRELIAAGAAGGARVLLARADIATSALADALRGAGAAVEELTAYRTVRPASLPPQAVEALRALRARWITFTSSSTVENFVALAEAQLPGEWRLLLAGVKLASIGPVTSATLRANGLTPAVEARPHTVEALAEAIRSGA